MAVERTLSIIKPDGVRRNLIGRIVSRIEERGMRVVAARMLHMTQGEAGGFYAVHRARPFYNDLCSFMSGGPVMVMVLEGENAIGAWRDLMGATDPKKAAAGTIRADMAENIEANTVHGSDGTETAAFEIGYFFPGVALTAR